MTYSGDDGTFRLTIPYRDYILVSEDGFDTLTGSPALPMTASPGSSVISPLTTMVSLGEDSGAVRQALEDHAGGPVEDVDLAGAQGVPADLLKINFNLGEMLRILENLGISDRELQERVMKSAADRLAEMSMTQPDFNLLCKQSFSAAVISAVRDLSGDPEVDFEVTEENEALFEANVAGMVEGIGAYLDAAAGAAPAVHGEIPGPVTLAAKTSPSLVVNESLVKAVIAQAVAKVDLSALKNVAKTVTLGCLIEEGMGGNFTQVFSGVENRVTVHDAAQAARFTITAENEFSGPKVYDKASLMIKVREVKGKGSLDLDLDGVTLVVGPGSNQVSLDTQDARLKVKLTLSDKTKVETTPTYGPFEILTLTGNSVVIDVAKIRLLLDQQVFGRDLRNADLTGLYDVMVKVKHAPAPNVSFRLQVL
ncbi:hypothetical protein [Desulfuromonas versatilis]|nr:hypothetical protein [Desulfuromonas versatilis]